MSMRHIAISGFVSDAAALGCGRTGIDSSNNLWWRGNWWRFDRRLFRTPLPVSGNPIL